MNTLSLLFRFVASSLRVVTLGLICVALLLTSCTSLRTVPFPMQPGQKVVVNVGDEIRVKTRNGIQHTLIVSEITADTFVGQNERIDFKDISALEVRRFDGVRTTLLVVGIVVVAGAALVGSVSPGPLWTTTM